MTLLELAAAIDDMPELGELERAALPTVTRVALEARRAGYRPTLEDLARSRLELEAWVTAGRQLEVERAQRLGLALQGERGVALAGADVDDGQAADELLVEQAAEALARRL